MQADEQINTLRHELRMAGWNRIWYIADAFRAGLSLQEIQQLTQIDRWFLAQIQELVRIEAHIAQTSLGEIDKTYLRHLKRKGFSDRRLAKLLGVSEQALRKYRHELGIRPVYKRVDTCAAEFSTNTAYLYSTYEEECEARPTTHKKVMVLGGGPNRIGQGIEFDYCCVHAALAIRELGFETIMVNCNPETVSTDVDISDRLYFEPLTLEDVLEIVDVEKPQGVIVQYGGQTPLKLARALEAAGVPILGTSPDAIDRAEDRERFQQLIQKLDLLQPPNGIVRSMEEGLRLANVFAYPLVVRPSYVLGGRAMAVIYNQKELRRYLNQAENISFEAPLLLDHFLDHAIEVDMDAICDGKEVFIGGIMEHIEQAGIHSGDSACSLPPHSLSPDIQERLRQAMCSIALELGVVGLMNAQFAIQDDKIYILEVNPRASRTVPFVAKATGVPLAKIAARTMVGVTLQQQGYSTEVVPPYYAVKMPVFPFDKFPGVDPILGPEMKSTGEVMGVGNSFGAAFAKALLGAGQRIPQQGRVFVSVREADKVAMIDVARELINLGFSIVATHGTALALQAANIACEPVNKVREGRPHIVDMIKNDEIDFIVNTTEGEQAIADSFTIRRSAVQHKVAYTTTLAGGKAICLALHHEPCTHVTRLQDLHRKFYG